MKERICITGCGVVSAIGVGQTANLESLLHARPGVGPARFVEGWSREFPVGEVPLSNAELSALCGAPVDWPRTTLLSIVALQEALTQAGLADGSGMRLIGGTTVGGMDLTERIFPQYSPNHGCGASTDLAALYVSGFEDATTLSTACSSAANAFIFGANLIRTGQCERVVVGGSESLSLYHLNGFHSLMILDRQPCRPFDATRAGLNLGEGAAYLVLETAESASKRGVKPLARLAGFGNACDAFHQTASSENGEGAFLAMCKALAMAELKPSDIDYVNAHGTGTPNNDASESTALKRLFNEAVPPVSSTKAFTGHTTSASGSIEAVFCLLALQHGFLPPQLNWHTPDVSCITPYCISPACRSELDARQSVRPEAEGDNRGQSPLKGVNGITNVICNAFGFGGNDSSLIFSAYE